MTRTSTTFAAVLAALSGSVLGAEIVVPTDMPLSVALASAADGDTITVLPSGSPYQQFPGLSVSNKRLTIRGSTGNPADVVIDGASLDIVLRLTNCDGTVLEGLTFRNGRGGTATESSGAGIYLNNTDITIRDCVIRDNLMPASDSNGGGVYGTASSLTMTGCVIENNTSASNVSDGMGMYFNGGSHVITDTDFLNNQATQAALDATGSIGGGFYADNGSAVITRCRFVGNRAGIGGAIGVSGSMTMTVDQCVVSNNLARQGAGYYSTSTPGGSTSRIRNSLFSANQTTSNDGAMYIDRPTILTNLTIVNNVSGGNYIIGGNAATGTVIVDNSILWGNIYNTTNGLFPANTPEVVRRCILQQAFGGASGSGFNRVVNPRLVGIENGDYHLSPDSPAIDSGDSNLYFGPFVDLDGNARGVDVPQVADTGFSLSGPVIDIGAFEFQVAPPPPECPGDFNRDGQIDFFDYLDFVAAFDAGC